MGDLPELENGVRAEKRAVSAMNEMFLAYVHLEFPRPRAHSFNPLQSPVFNYLFQTIIAVSSLTMASNKPNKLAFLSMAAPASYVAGLGRGCVFCLETSFQ